MYRDGRFSRSFFRGALAENENTLSASAYGLPIGGGVSLTTWCIQEVWCVFRIEIMGIELTIANEMIKGEIGAD